MLGLKKEVKNVCEEGVFFEFNVQLVMFELDENGWVNGVCFLCIELGVLDVGGRCCLMLIFGSEFVMLVDVVIMVFGFYLYCMFWLEVVGVVLDSQGCIKVGVESCYCYQISQEKIFVGGDVVCGVDFVVMVMVEGCYVVQGILDYLVWKMMLFY